jgi:hypothetical protein
VAGTEEQGDERPVSYAFYNSPYVAPALRRSEVLIELAQS